LKYYLDTSLVIALLTGEQARERTRIWLGGCDAGELCISPWVGTEVASALSIKQRMGDLTAEVRADIDETWRVFAEESLIILPVIERHFAAAAAFVRHFESGLRAGDALHLAVCQDHNLTLATLDMKFAEASGKAGVKTLNL
jgi:uncharacterized protein